jgi:hypothetical protein
VAKAAVASSIGKIVRSIGLMVVGSYRSLMGAMAERAVPELTGEY